MGTGRVAVSDISRYPLAWPQGWPRTDRRCGQFQVTLEKALAELHREIRLMGGSYPIVSSNMLIRKNGDIIRDQDEPADPGVAVYFILKDDKRKVFACDTFATVKDNIRGVGLTIEALRKIDRYGASHMLERALSAFEALPPPLDPWQILGLEPAACAEKIEARFRDLAFKHHPDRGGSTAKMAELNQARELALKGKMP
jgi:DnaJ-like protein